MISVENLSKTYGTYTALRDVTFNVQKGEVLGFLGPNGAGKTTTMRIVTGYMPASAGVAHVAGFDVFEQSIEARKRIGYLPESVPLYTEMTVWDYLDFTARLRSVKDRDAAIERAMELTNIDDRANQLIGKLSKGYRQRVGIAQAIVHNPDVLILDEPTIGLDPRQIIEIRNLIKSLAGEHTVVLSTHILPEVSQTCSRVLIIAEGKIVAEDTPERLTARVRGAEHVHLQVAKPTPDIATELEKILGVLSVQAKDPATGEYEIETNLGTDRRADIAAMAVQRGWGVLELRPVSMSLEEVFLKLTTEETAEPVEQ
ncbi:MAG: ABC transporter ATP-binding protein [Chloroflexi bacterium]|nr:ABC transporter ATP-binding protein [Chloroflexota bacterium]